MDENKISKPIFGPALAGHRRGVDHKAEDQTLRLVKLKLMTCLRLGQRPLGAGINFHAATWRDGIERAVNGLDEEESLPASFSL